MNWFITLFLLCIPGVNIGICIKGFKSENKNFYKAFLAYYCLMIVVGLVIRFFR